MEKEHKLGRLLYMRARPEQRLFIRNVEKKPFKRKLGKRLYMRARPEQRLFIRNVGRKLERVVYAPLKQKAA